MADSSLGDRSSLATPLPARCAFVVQLSRDSEPGQGSCVGQIEHVSSGRQARFATHEEMLTFMRDLLQRNREPEA
jgi:hypothetical protein